MGDEIKNYLYQLRQALPCVSPVPVDALCSLHRAQDYKGMVQFIKKWMNIEDVTIRVLWVPDGAASDGKQKAAPAWIKLPDPMPFYGTPAFRKMTLEMCIRKSFLRRSEYDQAAITIAHELSHVVLDSLAHPLRREEKAVDLTAMLLGFRNLYESGCYKEERLYNGMAWQKMGYLSKEEVQLANEILVPTSPNLFLMFTKSRFAKILFVMVVVAAWYGAVYGIPEHAAQPSPRKAAEGKPSLPPGLAAIPQPGIPPGWLATLGAR
jgi:hypothetical protein